jgi:hypothetical protein
MERAQMRALAEKKLESHAVEKVSKEQKDERRKGRERERRKPRLDEPAHAPPPRSEAQPEEPQAPVDRVKLFVDQGLEQGWDEASLAQAFAEAAGQPREAVLALEVKARHAYVVVKPDGKDAFLALEGKPLREAPLHVEVALSSSDKAKRRDRRDRPDRPMRERAPEPAEPHERLFLDQGKELGWDEGTLAQALCEAAGQPREALLRLDLRQRNAFAFVKPEAADAFLALAGKHLRDRALLIEKARRR